MGENMKKYVYHVTGGVTKTLDWEVDETIESDKPLKEDDIIDEVVCNLEDIDADDDISENLQVEEIEVELTAEQFMRKIGAPMLFEVEGV